jgi:hypothetical protein
MTDSIVTRAVLACVRFGNRQPVDSKTVAAQIAIRNSLSTVFRTVALGISSHPSYGHWKVDHENPGYLSTTFDGIEVRTPWNLVLDFPADATFQEFARLASLAKFRGDSTICIGGSILMRAAVPAIGDVDLCEYVSEPSAPFSVVAGQAIEHGGPELICLRVKTNVADGLVPEPMAVSLIRPWTNASSSDFLERAKGAEIGKCDFVVSSKTEGALEMTKIVLQVDRRFPDTEGPWELSFAPQEAALNGGSWVPRRLASPTAVARYVVWLFGQVQSLVSTAPCKAAKRALSLARILDIRELTEAARQIVSDNDFIVRSAFLARLDLLQTLAAMDDPPLVPVRRTLAATVGHMAEALDLPPVPPDGTSEVTRYAEMARRLLRNRHQDTSQLNELLAMFHTILEPAIRMGRY